MKRTLLVLLAVAAVAALAQQAHAEPPGNRQARRFAQYRTWHGNYAHWQYQQPLALVVPPTAQTSTSLAWGVAQSEVRPIYHQYSRNYPGAVGGGQQFRSTPYWPSHTDQFGVYYVRGPWGHY